MHRSLPAREWVLRVVESNRSGRSVGLFSVCSSHPAVLRAAMKHALEQGAMLSVESTSNQVNQFGGYTGMTPADFVAHLRLLAQEVGLDPQKILIGSDHLGPYPWRAEPGTDALAKACALARACALAGYAKIHLDASMACAGDPPALADETVAERAAQLCSVAEDARSGRSDLFPPLYVIGTEVPVPGGEQSQARAPIPTTPEHVTRTLDVFRKAFHARGLQQAWQRVVGLVVQSGAEFSDTQVFDYDTRKTCLLRQHLPESPSLVYESHSTDYQASSALKQMVEDHFAILKVGPWLTFAYREAIFALAALERDWLGGCKGVRLSAVRGSLELTMLRNPMHWQNYFGHQDETEQAFSRQFSFSDRCRYYWTDPAIAAEVALLLHNLSSKKIPLALLSQHFPEQYGEVRARRLTATPENLIEQRIRKVLETYSDACFARTLASS